VKPNQTKPTDSDTWRFVSPNYVLDTKNGFMWEVDVDLAKGNALSFLPPPFFYSSL
jgi:hypothetical protein